MKEFVTAVEDEGGSLQRKSDEHYWIRKIKFKKKPINCWLDLLMVTLARVTKRKCDIHYHLQCGYVILHFMWLFISIFAIAVILLYSFYTCKDLESKMLNILPQVKTANKLEYGLSSNYKTLSVANISGCERNKIAESVCGVGWGG